MYPLYAYIRCNSFSDTVHCLFKDIRSIKVRENHQTSLIENVCLLIQALTRKRHCKFCWSEGGLLPFLD